MGISVKVGHFTKDTTTGAHTQTVTGVGFQPKAVIFFSSANTATGISADANFMVGMSDGTGHKCAAMSSNDGAATSVSANSTNSANCIAILQNGANSIVAAGDIDSFNSDGWVVGWNSADAVAYKIGYIAIGGTDITNTKITKHDVASGAQVFTGIGFQPDFIFFLWTGRSGAESTASATHGGVGWGAAASSTQEGATQGVIEHGRVTSDTWRAQCVTSPVAIYGAPDGGIWADPAGLTSFDADGFTLGTINNADTGIDYWSLCIKGGNWDVGIFDQRTSNGTQNVTAESGMTPAFVAISSANNTTNQAIQGSATANCRISFGASDGTNDRGIWCGDTDAQATAEISKSDWSETKCVRLITESASSTVNAEANVTDLATAGQFSLNWTADATARKLWYFALKTAAAGAQFDRSPSADSVTVSDASLTAIRSLSRVPSSDSTTVSDASLTRMTQAFRSPSADSTTVTDASLTRVKTLPRVPTAEDVTVADSSTTRMLSAVRIPSTEVTTVDENITRNTQAFRTVSTDTVTPTDISTTQVITRIREPTADDVTAEDSSVTRTLQLVRLPSTDSTTVTDSSLTRILSASRAPSSDSVTALDSSVTRMISLIRLPTTEVVTAEDSGTTQSLTRVRLPTTEDITVSDSSLTRLLQLFRNPSLDIVDITEDVSGGKLLERAPTSDSVTVADSSLTRLLSSHRLPSADDITTGENLTRILSAMRSPSPESVTAEDSSTTQSLSRARTTNDTTDVSEFLLTRMLSASRSVSADSITISEDSLTRILSAIRLPSVEVITTSENVSSLHTTTGQFNRSPATENVIVGENLTRALQLFRVPSADTTTIVENSLSRSISRIRAASTDTVTVTEQSLTRAVSLSRLTTGDTTNVIEASLVRLLHAMRSPSADTVTVSELQSLISHSRSIQDTITVTEPVLQRIVTSIRQLGPEFVDVSEQVFIHTFQRFVFDSVTVAEQLFSIRQGLSGSVTYATADEVRPLLGNLGQQRTNAQIELAIAAAYDEINRKTSRIPPNDWKDTEPDFDIIKKICRFKAAYEMSIGIKDFESDRKALQEEINEMFMIIEQHDTGGALSNDLVISSEDETYALNPSGLIWSTRYKNLKKDSSGSENDTTINPDT